MMQQKVRNRRLHSLRQTSLNVEALEDRFLPAGPSGVVTAMLDPKTGVLMLQGSAAGNNSVRITPSPIAGLIRVQGQAFTSINAVTFTDFALSSITSIDVSLPTGGFTSLTVTGFSIPGNLRITGGAGAADTYSITNFNSNTISLTAGNSDNTITLNAVRNGRTEITTTGEKADNVTVSAATIGTATIDTKAGKADRVTLTGSTVGNLSITEGVFPQPSGPNGTSPGVAAAPGVQNSLVVTGNTFGKATVNVLSRQVDNGAIGATVTISNNTLTSNAANAAGNFGGINGAVPVGGLPVNNPPAFSLNVNADPSTGEPITVGDRQTYRVTVSNLVFNTGAPAVLYNGSANFQLGNATNTDGGDISTSILAISQVSGVNDFSLGVGANWNSITLDTLTARQLTTDTGNNAKDWTLRNTTHAGPAKAIFGNDAGNVLFNNIFGSVTPIDLALGRVPDLNVSFGNGTKGDPSFIDVNEGRDLNVTNGMGDTEFVFTRVNVGQNLTYRATPGLTNDGNETFRFTDVNVLNELSVILGMGVNSVSSERMRAATGVIMANMGNSPNSNVFFDLGGNSGFFVNGFDNFIRLFP